MPAENASADNCLLHTFANIIVKTLLFSKQCILFDHETSADNKSRRLLVRLGLYGLNMLKEYYLYVDTYTRV